jgi:hypothetical protein
MVFSGCDSGGDASTGTITMSLMDRPVDGVTAVNVTISEMWIKPRGEGPAVELEMTSDSITVDLLKLDDENASVLVDEAVVLAGSYNWVEMKVEDANIIESNAMTIDGRMVPMDVEVPSNRIRLVGGFEVAENQGIRFLFDWDVRKGLTEAVGRDVYLLRPAFRVLTDYGSISGTISADTILSQDANCNRDGVDPAMGKVVYIFDGHVAPGDISAVGQELVTTVDATLDEAMIDYEYRAVLMPGDYTVAFTCLGDTDTDEKSEDLAFLSPIAEEFTDGFVTVTAGISLENVDF